MRKLSDRVGRMCERCVEVSEKLAIVCSKMQSRN
jgi:hypothetical protein